MNRKERVRAVRWLGESIRHWQAVEAGATGIGADTCALCRHYSGCIGCPLVGYAEGCMGEFSAYREVIWARSLDWIAWRGRRPRTPEQCAAVVDMLTLLLLVREAEKGGGS